MRQAVIPCGGRATRLGERARATPKFLVEVAGRPFAHHKLTRLARAGFREVVLCVGHLGGAIRAAVGDGATFGLAVRYVDDGERPLGTWGALRAASHLLDPQVLVTYGDSLLPFDDASPLRALASHPWARGAMAVWRNDGALEPSNAAVEGEKVAIFAPSPEARRTAGAPLTSIDYGAIALRREAIETLPEGATGALGDLFASLARGGTLAAVKVPTRFFEIGTPEGLRATEAAVRDGLFDAPGAA